MSFPWDTLSPQSYMAPGILRPRIPFHPRRNTTEGLCHYVLSIPSTRNKSQAHKFCFVPRPRVILQSFMFCISFGFQQLPVSSVCLRRPKQLLSTQMTICDDLHWATEIVKPWVLLSCKENEVHKAPQSMTRTTEYLSTVKPHPDDRKCPVGRSIKVQQYTVTG